MKSKPKIKPLQSHQIQNLISINPQQHILNLTKQLAYSYTTNPQQKLDLIFLDLNADPLYGLIIIQLTHIYQNPYLLQSKIDAYKNSQEYPHLRKKIMVLIMIDQEDTYNYLHNINCTVLSKEVKLLLTFDEQETIDFIKTIRSSFSGK